MKRPIIEHASAYSADDANGSLLYQPSQRPPHQLTLRRPPPTLQVLHTAGLASDRAAMQALQLGNPMAAGRECAPLDVNLIPVLKDP